MIGTRIRLLRLLNGFTQEAFARLVNVSQCMINSYEIGHVRPPLRIIKKMSSVFHVSVNYLLSGEDVDSLQMMELDKLIGLYDNPDKHATSFSISSSDFLDEIRRLSVFFSSLERCLLLRSAILMAIKRSETLVPLAKQ